MMNSKHVDIYRINTPCSHHANSIIKMLKNVNRLIFYAKAFQKQTEHSMSFARLNLLLSGRKFIIHERSLISIPHRQKPTKEPPDYQVVFSIQKTNPPPVRIGKVWWRQQDSPISGARLLASGSGACSVTAGHSHASHGDGDMPSSSSLSADIA